MKVVTIGVDWEYGLTGSDRVMGMVALGSVDRVEYQPRAAMIPVFEDRQRSRSWDMYRPTERDLLKIPAIPIDAFRLTQGPDVATVLRSLMVDTIHWPDIMLGTLPEPWVRDKMVITMVPK